MRFRLSRILAYAVFFLLMVATVLDFAKFGGQFPFWRILLGCPPLGVSGGCIAFYVAKIPITALSALFIAPSVVLFERKFGWEGFGLIMIVLGMLDLMWSPWNQYTYLDLAHNPFGAFQVALVIGGWAIAGFPRPKIANKWLVLSLAVFVTGLDYHPFFATLFPLVYFSFEARS